VLVLKSGPLTTLPQDLESRRISLLNYIQDGGRHKYNALDDHSRMRWACRIIDMAEDMMLSLHHSWRTTNPRFRTELMQAFLPQAQAQLQHILQTFVQRPDKAEFSIDMKQLLQAYISLSPDSQVPHCAI
jgi:hypothetical protein